MVRAAIASLPRFCLSYRCASPRGPCGRHPSRAGDAPHLSRTARSSRSPPPSPHQPARHGGHLPSPSSAFCGRAPALLWPPSRPALCGTPHASPWCTGPFWGSFLWSFPVLPNPISVAPVCHPLLSGFGSGGAALCPLLEGLDAFEVGVKGPPSLLFDHAVEVLERSGPVLLAGLQSVLQGDELLV